MTLTKSFIPHHEYRDVLMDFRDQLFHRFFWVTLAIIGMATNLTLFQRPRPIGFIGIMLGFGLVFWSIRLLYSTRPHVARYFFVILLYTLLITLIQLQVASWSPYLIMPILLMSALLMSNSLFIGTLSYGIYYTVIGQAMSAASVEGVLAITIMSAIFVWFTISTFNVALSWYSSMHHHADALLKESRDHRAELVGTLKSLETAYQAQRRLQQQLVYARQQAEEARRMKERFASNISHELRTPLNIILGFSEIMHLTPEIYGDVFFPPKLHRDIYQIHHNSKHLLAMIDDVLDLSHIELSEFSLNFEATQLTEFLPDAITMLAPQFDNSPIELMTHIPPDLPTIEIDRTRIRQVIINLMTNALRFTETGYVKVSASADQYYVDLIVEDTGRGMTADQMKLIFEEFYQVDYSLSRQHGGAGLGLAITKQFVEAHNGTLSVESTIGKGSIFTVSLPIPEQNQKQFAITQIGGKSLPQADETIICVGVDNYSQALLSRHLAPRQVIAIPDSDHLTDCILEYHPIAVIHNRLPSSAPLESLSVPVIECALPNNQWLDANLPVDLSLPKPVSPQQVTEILGRYHHVDKILIVDDDIGFVQLIQRSIEGTKGHYAIRRAYDGVQACDIIAQNTPDLMFLDVSMPEMTGLEVLDFVQDNPAYHDITIVLLTTARYLQSDRDWFSDFRVHQADGINTRQTLKYLQAILG